MKRLAFQLVSSCLLFACAGAVGHAQSGVKVKVPFNFVVSGRTFPSGQYSVSSPRGDLIVLQDSSGKSLFIGTANAVSGHRVGETGQVVFHCYEDRCFLAELWTPNREAGSQLLPSRQEHELAKRARRTEFALLDQAPKN